MNFRPSLILVHQFFAPEPAGSAQQLTDLALGLQKKGFPVNVVTGQPGHSLNGKLPNRENYLGIRVDRVPRLRLSRNFPIGRILNAVSFFVMAFTRLLGMDRRSLLVIGSDPPFLGLAGWLLRTLRAQRYILIISDLYPDVAVALGELSPGGWVTKLLEGSNRLAFRKAEKIVVLGERMAERVGKIIGGGADPRIQIIHNWADGDRIRPIPKSENRFRMRHRLLKKITVLYSGNLGKIYDFETVLKAAGLLGGNSGVEFLFIGEGPLRKTLEHETLSRGIGNVRLLPFQPESELPESLSGGDLALIPLKKEVTGLCVPGKLYCALAAGIPLLVMASEESEPAEIVRKNDCGWWVPPENAECLAGRLRDLAGNPALLAEKARKARDSFDRFFTRDRAIRQYESVLLNA